MDILITTSVYQGLTNLAIVVMLQFYDKAESDTLTYIYICNGQTLEYI